MNISVECPNDLGANLVQHFIGRYSRCSRYRTKSHDKATISNDITRYSRYQTVLLKLQEITRTAPQSAIKWHPSVYGGCHSCYPASYRGRQSIAFGVRAKNSPQDCFFNALTVLEEIISTFGRNLQKMLSFAGHFLLSLGEQLNLPMRAS